MWVKEINFQSLVPRPLTDSFFPSTYPSECENAFMRVDRSKIRIARACRRWGRYHRSVRARWQLRWEEYFRKRPLKFEAA